MRIAVVGPPPWESGRTVSVASLRPSLVLALPLRPYVVDLGHVSLGVL